ncbi:MAG: hypothetical protein GOMPHAMPRED_003723 [Gomphillus americanus]|uniref:Ankyrin n=1 Tax=Gomphillus americanus TaxID=1940652 RepID=A0A8H3FHW9_9LECA|nr:MAG: hypothetical protein GOMPHAMPRED_003723 [Gomphillus americanus]
MVRISLPYKPDVPATTPGMRVSVALSPHIRFIDDVGYYDAMGRDPLQMFQVWGIQDPTERVSKLEEILSEWPGPRHRRHILKDAAMRGDEAVVQFLVNTGLKVHPDIPGRNGIPPHESEPDDEEDNAEGEKDDITVAPLHIAAMRGRLGCVRILLEGDKMNVDIRDEFGRTPLCAAAQGGHAEVIEYLINQGANPTIRLDAENKITQEYFGILAGANALEFAASNSAPEIIKLLLQHPLYGSKRSRKNNKSDETGVYVTPLAIYQAAVGRNIETLKYLLQWGSYPLIGEEGKTKGDLLDEAQKEGIVRFVPEIVESASYDATQTLLSYLYLTDKDGEVLPFAVPDEMHRLFIWGAYRAILNNDCKKFEWIYRFGLKEHDSMSLDELPEGQNLNIQHLLDKATEAGSLDCVRMLIEKYGALPDTNRLPAGIRPIYTAAMYDQSEVVRYYLKNHKIDLHFGNGAFISGPTALYGAISMKSLESVELFLKQGGPVDHIDDEISETNETIKAVLIAEIGSRTPIRLQTEANAMEYIEKAKGGWQNFNPLYVRLELDLDDEDWISKLVPRMSDAELREKDTSGRRFDKDDKTRKDPTPYLPAYPFSEDRREKLDGDDDIVPAWKPLLVPAGN